MVKKYSVCLNCDGIDDVKTCSMCNHLFCRKCIESRNLKIEGDINGSVIDYCAFNCIGSRGRKFCDTCGVDYINMIKCNYCEGTFCYTCRIKNFEREINSGEKIEGSIYRTMTNYCSNMCYVTFKAESNDEIKSCIKCPTPFVEMKCVEVCDLCRNKESYRNFINSNNSREKLREYIIKLIEHSYEPSKIEEECQESFNKLVNEKYKFVNPNIIKFKDWYDTKDAGSTLIFVIWDTVILKYLRSSNMVLDYIL